MLSLDFWGYRLPYWFLMMILSIWTFYMFFVRFSLLQIKSLSLEFLDHDVYFNYNFSLIHQILIILRMGHLLHWRMFLPTHRYPILCKPFVLSFPHKCLQLFYFDDCTVVIVFNFFFSILKPQDWGLVHLFWIDYYMSYCSCISSVWFSRWSSLLYKINRVK